MAVLNAVTRNAIPTSEFAGPGRTYPVEDAAHARDALSRVSAQQNSGGIGTALAAHIRARAKAKLAEVNNR